MITKQLLLSTSHAIRTMEETLNELDPFNHQFPEPGDSRSIRDCEFTDIVKDPLTLVRELRGEDFTNQLEYADDLEFTLQVLSDCFNEELTRRGMCESDLYSDWSDDDEQKPETGSQ
jgi:hypothetical protein